MTATTVRGNQAAFTLATIPAEDYRARYRETLTVPAVDPLEPASGCFEFVPGKGVVCVALPDRDRTVRYQPRHAAATPPREPSRLGRAITTALGRTRDYLRARLAPADAEPAREITAAVETEIAYLGYTTAEATALTAALTAAADAMEAEQAREQATP